MQVTAVAEECTPVSMCLEVTVTTIQATVDVHTCWQGLESLVLAVHCTRRKAALDLAHGGQHMLEEVDQPTAADRIPEHSRSTLVINIKVSFISTVNTYWHRIIAVITQKKPEAWLT